MIIINICIVGAGNIGVALSVELTYKGHNVSLLTSVPQKWQNEITLFDKDKNKYYTSNLNIVTNNTQTALQGIDIILITVPSNALSLYMDQIIPLLTKGTIIGVIPGTGGAEFYKNEIISKKATIFGLQRVPAVYRLDTNSSIATVSGKREFLHAGYFSYFKDVDIKEIVEELFGLETIIFENYLNITLTPSNPILHTSRLYDLFSNGDRWTFKPRFYEDWRDSASEVLLGCDQEVQQLVNQLNSSGVPVNGVNSLKKHYNVKSVSELTSKITNIPAFKDIFTPMVKSFGYYYPDLNSRYFLEDFEFGIFIIKDYCNVMNINTPYIDKIINWYKTLDICKVGNNKLPRNVGINSIEDIKSFYLQS